MPADVRHGAVRALPAHAGPWFLVRAPALCAGAWRENIPRTTLAEVVVVACIVPQRRAAGVGVTLLGVRDV